MRRRRLLAAVVALIGVLATAFALSRVAGAQGSYVGEAQVAIFSPRLQPDDNPLASTDTQAIKFASVVVQVVNNAVEVPRVTSHDLTLADQGMRHQSIVSLLNLGGQWADDFSRPYIRIQAVDSSQAATEARLQESIDEVFDTLDRLQDEAGVAESDRATAQLLPAAPRVWYEGTHEREALLATALLGLVLTWGACLRLLRASPAHRSTVTGSSLGRRREPVVERPVARVGR